MEFGYSEEVTMLRDTVRRFMDEKVIPLEATYGDDQLPREVQAPLSQELRGLGLWNMEVPEEFGGGGLSAVQMAPLREQISKTILGAGHGGGYIFSARVPSQLYNASPEIKEQYLMPALRGE